MSYTDVLRKLQEDKERREAASKAETPDYRDVLKELQEDQKRREAATVPAETPKKETVKSLLKKGLNAGMNFAATGTLSANDIADPVDVGPMGYLQKGALEGGVNRKNVSKAILGTTADASTDLTAGVLGIGEGAMDAVATVFPFIQNAQFYQNGMFGLKAEERQQQQFALGKQAAGEFVKQDIVDEQKVARNILAGFGVSKDYLEEQMEKDSVFAEKSDSLLQSGGQLLGTAALTAMGIPGDVVIGLTAFGGEAENALKQGTTLEEAGISGLVSAGAEVLSEKISGGIKLGGKTLDDKSTRWLARNISDKAVRTLAKLGMDMAGEGLEEVTAGLMSAIGQKMTYMDDKKLREIFTEEDAWDAFVSGALMGMGGSAAQTVRSAIKGTDAVTGLTTNEQKVIDKVFADEVAKAEKNGKVTEGQKAKIYEEVVENMEKGYISTDTIEEVLGGEKYEQYMKTKDWEESLQKDYDSQSKELDTLRNTKAGDMTDIQTERLAELKEKLPQLKKQLDNVKATSTLADTKARIGTEVSEMVKADRLSESYAERNRKGQAYQADLNQYQSDAAKKTVRNAMDHGVNNQNRSHEFVEALAKLSEETGHSFDFTDNKQLKEMGYTMDGVTINGFVNKDGITVNLNSKKYLNSVVGHEVTHLLEGTSEYDVLQKAMEDYVNLKGKGTWDKMLSEVSERYKNVEGADYAKELTADLVGDYLFTDKGFVNHLSKENSNIFQRVYDEIKHLVKTFTGTREGKQLETVKRAFDEAFKAQKNTVTEDGVRYALASIEDVTPDDKQKRQNIQTVAKMDSVHTVDASKLIPGDKSIKEIYQDYAAEWGGNIHSEVFGDIAVKNSSIRSEMRHGSTPVKVASIEAVPSVIHGGKIVEWIQKDSGLFRIVVAAPIKIGNTPYFMGVMLQRDGQNQRLYLHDVVIEKEASDFSQEHLDSTGPYEEKENLYTSSILDKIAEVKAKGNDRLSLSSNDDIGPAGGGWNVYGSDIALQQNMEDIGPVRDDIAANSLAPEERLLGISTNDRLAERVDNLTYERSVNAQNRAKSAAQYTQEIAKLQAQYDAKKNKNTKVANALLRRIANLERLKADVDGDYARRDARLGERIEKLSSQMNQDHTEKDRLEAAYERIDRHLEGDKLLLAQKIEDRRMQLRSTLENRDAFISDSAHALYWQIVDHKKGEQVSRELGYLLDHGYSWQALKGALLTVKDYPDRTVNWGSAEESAVRELLGRQYEEALEEYDGLEGEYSRGLDELEAQAEKDRELAREEQRAKRRSDVRAEKLSEVSAALADRGFDLDQMLDNAKDRSTFTMVDNTPQRALEKTFGYEAGQALADATVNKVAQNETAATRWMNNITDRKEGLLKQLSDQYHIKPGSKESAAAQMYAEGFYVDDAGECITYADAELAADFPNADVQRNIKGLAADPRIREFYDDTLDRINEARTRNAYPEIPKLDNYFLHFRAMEDTFSKLGIPFNPNEIKAKDLPTDLAGVTADLKPGQPFFSSSMHRRGWRTSYDLLGGMERYAGGAKNQIFHIDDIQTLRALQMHVAQRFGQAEGLENLNELTDEEAMARIEKVYDHHLSTFASFLNTEANILAGKTSMIDRALSEGVLGRRVLTVMDTINKQVGSNMVGYNISSAFTNVLPVVQTMARSNKADFVKAFAQTAANIVRKGRFDTFRDDSSVMVRRKGSDRFNRTLWQKMSDPGYALMGAIDNISAEIIARTKFNELTRKGMDMEAAHYETDKWVSRLMGDRSLGQMPQVYTSRMLGLLTKFQLEVRNQIDSQFYDTVQEAKHNNRGVTDKAEKTAKIAAKVISDSVQLAVLQHLFGIGFEAVAGYNPAFDIIEAIVTAFGRDDEEDSEDTVLDNLGQGLLTLAEDMPYTSLVLDGGRIPVSAAFPNVEEFLTGVDEYGSEVSRWETVGKAVPYYLLPGGYGQIKKTTQGLKMFDDDLPTTGSYTDSGKLRFPVEKTPGNVLKAAVFGQYASKNARDYFDQERTPLEEKQITELRKLGIPVQDYWEYRDGLRDLDTLAEKADYIAGLDMPVEKKNILINNVADRDEKIDLTHYEKYKDFEEFDFAINNPEKYKFLQDNGVDFDNYYTVKPVREAYNWAFQNQEKYDFLKGMGVSLEKYMASGELTKEAYSWAYENQKKNKFLNSMGVSCIQYKAANKPTKDAYDWAYENQDKLPLANAVAGDVVTYRKYTDALGDIKADKDANGKSISGSRKSKVRAYIDAMDADEMTKMLLWKMEYNSDDSYNDEIFRYVIGLDLTYAEMVGIFEAMGATVDANGYVKW